MTCDELLDHSYFDHFREWFQPELDLLLAKDTKKPNKSRAHVVKLMMFYFFHCIIFVHLKKFKMGNRRSTIGASNNSGAVPVSNPNSGLLAASGLQGDAAGRHLPQLKLIREKTPVIPGELTCSSVRLISSPYLETVLWALSLCSAELMTIVFLIQVGY